MAFIFRFPDIGEGIAEGKIIQWYVKVGERVKSGDSLVKMETDKVVTDIPSPKTGTISKLYGKAEETINVEDPLVEILLDSDGGISDNQVKEEKMEAVEEKGFGVVGTIEVASGSDVMPASSEGQNPESGPEKDVKKRVLATPVARAMAKDMGIDIREVNGTGPAGRIMKADIRLHHERINAGAAIDSIRETASRHSDILTEADTVKPISHMRKVIAKNMVQSKQTAPHMTAFEEVEISELIAVRAKYKSVFADDGIKLTYMPFIIKAVTEALKAHPELNAQFNMEKEQIIIKSRFHIGMAVDTEEGLIVPVIKHADQKSIREIAVETNDLATRGHKRELKLEELQNGTFTVTNYGSIAGTFGVPIINYPQVAILGVGRIMKVPVVKGDNIEVGHVLPLSLSVDHRMVDGGEAARFLLKLKSYLNDPVAMLMG